MIQPNCFTYCTLVKWACWCYILFQCLGKLRHDHEEETRALHHHHQNQREAQNETRAGLNKLLSGVQVQIHRAGRVETGRHTPKSTVTQPISTLHSSSVCLWQEVKQDLSEVFGVYVSFASELEEQSKQLLEKVEQASSSVKGHRGDEVQGKYLSGWSHECSVYDIIRNFGFRGNVFLVAQSPGFGRHRVEPVCSELDH